jgi:hypothetical protein
VAVLGAWRAALVTLAIARTASGNAKLGDAATTHAAQVSCPSSCRFRDGGGCYAESGRQGMFVTRVLNDSARELRATALDVALAEAEAIDDMQVVPGRPTRLHTVGDCPDDECARIVSAAAERYMQRGGGQVWTYTHAWRDVDRASWGKVSVLASCETPEHVFEARQRGYATALVVEEFPTHRRYAPGYPEIPAFLEAGEPLGQDVLPCPAQTRDRSCSDCRLCFDDETLRRRGYSIGFELHGIPYAVRQARQALRNPDDPLRRIPSEERIRIIRERYLRIERREPTVREVCEMIDLNESSVAEWLRYLRGEIVHPAERRRRARLKVVA